MLHDPHVKVVRYEEDATRIFPNTEIKGGLAIILYDRNCNFGAIEEFIPNPHLEAISKRFTKDADKGFSSIVFSGRSDLKFTDLFLKVFPNTYNDRLSAIKESHPNVTSLSPNEEYELKSSTFEVLPYVFLDKEPADGDAYYKLIGLSSSGRSERWIKKEYMTPRYQNNNIDSYKVLLPESNGNGNLGEALSNPIVVGPSVSSTPTFISIGCFDSKLEADNLLKYIKTKFTRTLLAILKNTQHNPASVWAYVPLQNFTYNSDIDWEQPISNIDKQLYAKYGLTKEEIEFIETHVKSMDPEVLSPYQKLLNISYNDCVKQLLDKYGAVRHNYFQDTDCTVKNKLVSRTADGLYCHHIDEDKAIMLCNDKFASANPFDYQKADRLVYCNLLEHLLLHVKIAENPNENANENELPGVGGAINFICKDLNDIYAGKEQPEWKEAVVKAVKDDFDDYILILKYLWKVVELNPIYKMIITKDMLCKGYDGKVNESVLEALNS